MESHIVKIASVTQVTHDVRSFRIEKPQHYQFIPGQATEVAINQDGWQQERRPFTFTSLNEDPWLEFTIKRYDDHRGVTARLHELQPGDELIIHDVWGAIEYKGPGYFIAGGAGITPFIAIFRQLYKDHLATGNTLFFSNKTAADIIYEKELKTILGAGAHYLLTRENNPAYVHGYIDKQFLEKHISDSNQYFYVCGPDRMVGDIRKSLAEIGATAETVVIEI